MGRKVMLAVAVLRSRARATMASALVAGMRTYGTSLPVPTPPPGSETVFTRQQMPKYSLSNPKWFSIFFAMNLGAYMGHFAYLKFVMTPNPPNPPRDPDHARPEKHMHSVDDE